MNYRRWTPIAEWSLVATVLVMHGALLAGRQEGLRRWGQIGSLLSDATPMAQLALLTLWATLGPGGVWVRLAFTLPILGLCSIGWRLGWDYGTEKHLLWMFGGAAAIMGLVGAVLSCAGWRLHSAERGPFVNGSQFTIRTLLLITTLVAATIGGLEAVRPWLKPTIPEDWIGYPPLLTMTPGNPYFPRLWLAQAMIAAMGLGTAWAMLRPGTVWLRLIVLAFAAPLAGWYEDQLTVANADFAASIGTWNSVFVVLTALSLVPVRLMNFRLFCPSHLASSADSRAQASGNSRPAAAESGRCAAPESIS